jgi:hypothetical protein
VPKNPANRTAPEIVEKVLHLRKTYRLGPIRIVWYLARYRAITISGRYIKSLDSRRTTPARRR